MCARRMKMKLLLAAFSLLEMSSSWAQGMPPAGPPEGAPPGDGPGGAPPPNSRRPYTLSGEYVADGVSKSETGRAFTASKDDVSAVYATNKAQLTLTNPMVSKSGNTTSDDNSSFYGLNAAVLSAKESQVTISGGTIKAIGSGANGVFAADKGRATLRNMAIEAHGTGAHGVMAAGGGELVLENVRVVTTAARSAAIATDRGSGRVTVSGGKVLTTGTAAPCLYSTGDISVSGGEMLASGSEAVVIEGQNSISLRNTVIEGQKSWGVMIYQSFSGDAEGMHGRFSMQGGSLTAKEGPLFYVNNSTATIKLDSAILKASSGVLVKAAADKRWGKAGSNAGHVLLVASQQTLEGNLEADAISSISASLSNGSVFSGAAHNVALTLDASSQWNVTADSTLTSLTLADKALDHIVGNGHTVYYRASLAENQWLAGKTYTLKQGGVLAPQN